MVFITTMSHNDIDRDIDLLNSGNIPPGWSPKHISHVIAEREKKFLQEAGIKEEKSLMQEQDEEYEKALNEQTFEEQQHIEDEIKEIDNQPKQNEQTATSLPSREELRKLRNMYYTKSS